MNQILNLLLFLRELIFGRDASARMTRAQRIKSTIAIAVIFISLVANWHLFTSLYETTARSLELKQEIIALNEKLRKDRDLEIEIAALDRVIKDLTRGVVTGELRVTEAGALKALDTLGATITHHAPDQPIPLPSHPKVVAVQPPSIRDETVPSSPRIE